MKQRKSRHEQQNQEESFVKTYLKPVGIGLGVGVAVLFVLLLIFSLIISAKDFPSGLILPLSLFCLSVGALAAGFVSAKLAGEHGLFYGFCCGLILSILILICTMITGQSYLSVTGIYKFLCAIIFASLGGIFGVNQRRRRK
ncbi:TIGR04086 family membrane protein [Zongyangia hominis]|uniref:TIGR04086 family membrane protein n=1 Tax=Zongyangia hominis TaxID=2763677 RepID=A0A926I630_9FIRM|nr:TIGR04086 family membrane protein [Zongyangia hominis]MBC8569579.1 TIGR04086 family membrane protein [Zongyangia hominis]